MTSRRWVLVVAAFLIGSACGSSDTPTAEVADESVPPTVGASGAAEVAPESVPSTDGAGAGHHDSAGDSEAPAAPADRPTNAEFNGEERTALSRQLLAAREVALALPTYGDALASGYEPTTPYAPGTGAHMGKDADTQAPGAELDVSRPQSIMYAGTEVASPVVGLMYVQLGGDTPPEGFAGPLDTWENPVVGQCLKPDELDPMFPTSG